MDVFVEYMVKRKWGIADWLKLSGVITVGAIIFCAGMILFATIEGLFQLSFLLLIGIIALIYFYATRQLIEYEYTVTNGYVAIDAIYAKKSRKRLISFESRDLQVFDAYDPIAIKKKSFDTRVLASGRDDPEKDWYAVFTHKAKGKTLLVFSPNSAVLGAMKPFVPRNIGSPVWRKTK